MAINIWPLPTQSLTIIHRHMDVSIPEKALWHRPTSVDFEWRLVGYPHLAIDLWLMPEEPLAITY